MTIEQHDTGKPVTDLATDSLAVVVSTAGVDSPSLALEPAFDAVEATGPPGEYDAALVPTAPGDYTFHMTGSIHGTAVDLTLASGAETFEPVVGSGDLEFPAKLPSLGDVATRLDRIDRGSPRCSPPRPARRRSPSPRMRQRPPAAAAASADRALLIGGVLGGAGLVARGGRLVAAVLPGPAGGGPAPRDPTRHDADGDPARRWAPSRSWLHRAARRGRAAGLGRAHARLRATVPPRARPSGARRRS